MEIATKESILSLLNSTDSDDVKLGIIVLLREAESQQEVVDITHHHEIHTNEYSFWRCKDKWAFINNTYIISSIINMKPSDFSYIPFSDKPVIHEVYDPE